MKIDGQTKSETTRKKLDRQRPSKKGAQLVKNVAKAKVVVFN